MSDRTYNVLFVCTANSARSILAEALLNHLGAPRFQARSAGSQPSGQVHPLAVQTLQGWHLPTAGLRSKSWQEFATTGTPAMDFVFTVCDNAAGETCPVWPGQPTTAHWGVPDPAAPQPDAGRAAQAFLDTAVILKRRIELLLALPMDKLDALALHHAVGQIGRE